MLAGSLSVSLSLLCPPEMVSLAHRCTAYDPIQRSAALQVAFELRTLLLQGHSSSTLSLMSDDRMDDEEVGESTVSATATASDS